MNNKKEYIEREALMRFPIRLNHYDKEHGNEHFVLGIESVLEYAESLPAADVEVVRHGAWVEYWDDNYLSFCHKSSECGGLPLTKEETIHDEVLSAYCPHCGAKMDGKGEGE